MRRRRSRLLAASYLLASLCTGCPHPVLWLGQADADADASAAGTSARVRVVARPQSGKQPASVVSVVAGARAAGSGDEQAGSSGVAGWPVTPPLIDDAADGGTFPPQPPRPTRLPVVTTACPVLKGSGSYVFGDPRVRTLTAQIYVAPNPKERSAMGGPLILYWHSFGADPSEVVRGLGQPAIDAVVQLGGVVAAFSAKLCVSCELPEDVGWYDADDAVSDQLVACAIRQANIDTRRIHSVGFSAGGLHSIHLALARSDYIASVVSYSGGLNGEPAQPQDPDNHVAALLTYGARGIDFVGVDFSDLSWNWYERMTPRGYYTLMCDHGRGHELPDEVIPQTIRFLIDHSYKLATGDYDTRIPSQFPAICSQPPKPR
jgi:predicted esterase